MSTAAPTPVRTTDKDRALAPNLPKVREALANLEAALGGRDALVEVFTAAPETEDGALLLGLLADPRNDSRPLSALCEEIGLSAGSVLRLYRTASLAKAQVLAIHEVAQHTPAVVADVMRRAQNHYRICGECQGTGEVWEPIKATDGKIVDYQKAPHRACDGSGQVLVDASPDHQKLALDLASLTPKAGPSTLVQVDNSRTSTQVAVGVMPFAHLQKAVQKVLETPRLALAPAQPAERFEAPVIDAEPLPVSVAVTEPPHAPAPPPVPQR